MSQSLAKVYVHAIFSTKDRLPCLASDIRAQLYPYAATVLKNLDCPALQVGGTADHIHILCALSKNLSVAKFIEEAKTPTSKWLKTKAVSLRRFHWQNGYGAFSVSQSNVKRVIEYIAAQGTKHKTMTFENEYRGFLRKYEIPFDERHVWD